MSIRVAFLLLYLLLVVIGGYAGVAMSVHLHAAGLTYLAVSTGPVLVISAIFWTISKVFLGKKA